LLSLTENLKDGDILVFTANGSINKNDELVMGSGIAKRVRNRFTTLAGENIGLVFGKLVSRFGNRPFIVPALDTKTNRKVFVASLPVKPETTPKGLVKKEDLLPKYRNELDKEAFIQGWKFRVKPSILEENLKVLVKELNSLPLNGKVLVPLVDCKKSELNEAEVLKIYDQYLSRAKNKVLLFTKSGIVKEYKGGAELSREEKLLMSIKTASGCLTADLIVREREEPNNLEDFLTRTSKSDLTYVLDWIVYGYRLYGGELAGEERDRFVITPEGEKLYLSLARAIGKEERLASVLTVEGEGEYHHGHFNADVHPVRKEKALDIAQKLFTIKLSERLAREERINFVPDSNYFSVALGEARKFIALTRFKRTYEKLKNVSLSIDVSFVETDEAVGVIERGDYYVVKGSSVKHNGDLTRPFDYLVYVTGNKVKGIAYDEYKKRVEKAVLSLTDKERSTEKKIVCDREK